MSFECFVVRLKWKVFPFLLAPFASSHLRSTLITFLYTLSALEWQTTTATRGWIILPNSSSVLWLCCFFCITCENRREKYMKRSCCVMKIPLIQKQIFDIDFFLRSQSSLHRFCHHRFIFAGFVRFVCRLGLLSFLVALCSGPGQKNTLSVTKTFLRELRNIIKDERQRHPLCCRMAYAGQNVISQLQLPSKRKINIEHPPFSELISPSNPSIAWLKEFQLWNARIFNIKIRRNWFSFHKREEATFRPSNESQVEAKRCWI